jgi:hypothetical protein
MGSALGLSTFSAKAGNILNQDGGPALYSGGVWNFENSSGVSTFTISDAGVVTASGVGAHTFGSNAAGRTYLAADCATGAGNSANVRFSVGGVVKGYVGCWHTNEGTGDNGASDVAIIATQNLYFSTGGAASGKCVAGAWTLGPASSTPGNSHLMYGALGILFNGSNPLDVAAVAATGSARQVVRFRLGATSPFGGTSCGGIQTTDGVASPAFYTGTSDERLKKDIQDAPIGALNRLCAVRLRDFRLVDDEASSPLKRGVIAQELQQIYPDKVHERDDGFLCVSMGYDWELIQAIQEQQAIIEDLKTRLAALESK